MCAAPPATVVAIDVKTDKPTSQSPGRSPFFTAISDVMLRAKRQRLEPDDLLLMHETDDIRKSAEALRVSWERTLTAFKREQAAKKEADKQLESVPEEAPAPSAKKQKKPKKNPDEKLPSLANAIWPQLRGLWFFAFGALVASVGLQFLGPVLLGWTIRLIQSTQQCSLREAQDAEQLYVEDGILVSKDGASISADCRAENEVHLGYVYAAAMLVSKLLEALLRSWHDHTMTRLALRARGAIIATIYRKCLWLSGMGTNDATTGQIQNLMANDAQFFLQIAPMFNNLFLAPVQIIVCFVWLATLIGPSFLAGILAMVVSMPMQAMVLKTYFVCQMKRLKLTDQRVRLTNEMVQGIRVVKMYAWEQTIEQKIAEVRKEELRMVRTQRFASAFLSVFMTTLPLFMTVSVFSVYAATGGKLSAIIVLPALALLGLLRMPIAFLPMILMQLLSLKASLGRITKFLMNEELDDAIKARCLAAELEAGALSSTPTSMAALVGEALAETPDTRAAISELLSTAADAAAVAVELVTTPSVADDAPTAVAPAEPEAPSHAEVSVGGTITIQGSFRWAKVEVPVGKGKGKGKGKGGKGRGGGGGGRGGGGADKPPRLRSGRWSFKAGGQGTSSRDIAKPSPDKASSTADAAAPAAAAEEKKEDKKAPMPPVLRKLSVSFPARQLTMIAGPVGCGKSSMISALLGELRPAAADGEDSKVGLAGAVGYFAQTPFILNDTLRGNILLGSPMDDEWYEKVLAACALLPDLAILPGGDMTQIGEKGINLSGGQKARVALARACYARAQTLLLDDPLSAVDAHVGKHIFREVLGPKGLMASTTRILVTHQTQFLPLADRVIVLEQGAVLAQGSYQQLRDSDVDLSAIASLSNGADVDADDILTTTKEEAAGGGDKAEPAAAAAAKLADKRGSEKAMGDATKGNKGAAITGDEERATGSVSWEAHLAYLRAMGGPFKGLLLLLFISWDKSVAVMTDYWLALWIDPSSSELGQLTPHKDEFGFWIPIYIGGLLLAGVSVYWRSVYFNVGMGLRAARVIYGRLNASILAAPMIFFETTPSGRILNRFTSDTEQVDFALLMTLAQWSNCVSNVFGALALICTVNPWFLCVLPFFGAVYVLAYWCSCSATRDLQRLEAVTRSPIFTHFSETLNGLSTIRAFGRTSRFEEQNFTLVAANTRCFFNQDLASQWIAQRLDFCSAAIAAITVLLPILVINFGSSLTASPAAFGLCITYALELSAFLKFGTKMTLDIQRGMAGVERILEYAEGIPSEPTGGTAVPGTEGGAQWPSAGRIVTTNMCVRYRPELPLALRGVSCVIEPCAKVGIVGRTGSGKTTFVSALWRLVEPTAGGEAAVAGGGKAGPIAIDGVDISGLNLRALRSRLAIIVQDPVLFNESVRYNLDPFSQSDDAELERVIELVQLKAPIAALPEGLKAPVGEAGANFSVGQRQLICLARAMLRRSKLIVLDEATASIDNETDAILQSTIRETFADATVLTIAHRLHTIMDSTQIMVFDKGELKEYDAPEKLLADDDSLFSKLVADTGSAAQHLRSLADEAATRR